MGKYCETSNGGCILLGEFSRALGHPARWTVCTLAKSALAKPQCLVDPLTPGSTSTDQYTPGSFAPLAGQRHLHRRVGNETAKSQACPSDKNLESALCIRVLVSRTSFKPYPNLTSLLSINIVAPRPLTSLIRLYIRIRISEVFCNHIPRKKKTVRIYCSSS